MEGCMGKWMDGRTDGQAGRQINVKERMRSSNVGGQASVWIAHFVETITLQHELRPVRE